MHSLKEDYLREIKFSADELSLLKTIGNYQGKQERYYEQSPEVLENLKKAAAVESTESSNRLEGITAPHHRISALVLKDSKPTNRTEQEIAGYRDALNLLHHSSKEMPLSLNIIRQLHSYLYRYLPYEGGEWKTVDNTITEKLPDGTTKVRFKPTSAFGTPLAMESLVEKYKYCINQLEIESLLVIPAFILDFLCIHPFRDGNGRTARLLTLQLLYHFGYQVGRYISLERIFEESKESYYETLEKSSKGWHEGVHDLKPWANYFWGTLLRAYAELELRVGAVNSKKGSKADKIRLTIAETEGSFSVSDIERLCPAVSRDTIRLVFRALRDEGVIQSIGKGRGTRWEKIKSI